MARDFDGANDNIDFGSATDIDQLNPKSIALYVKQDATTFRFFLGKDRFAAAWGFGSDSPGGFSDRLFFTHAFSGTSVTWLSTTVLGTTSPRHVAIVYDRTATTNDPLMWIDGIAETVITVEGTDPTGTANTDAAANLRAGETGGNGADFDGQIGWVNYTSGSFSSADVNRSRWWGRAMGGLVVYHPWMTTKLTNEGSGTANGTASGTTVVGMPVPVVRPGSALMGLGVGW